MKTFCASFMDETWRAAESSERHSPLIRTIMQRILRAAEKKPWVAEPQEFKADPVIHFS